MASIFPSAHIVWSDTLPRLFWFDILNTPKNLGRIDQKRKKYKSGWPPGYSTTDHARNRYNPWPYKFDGVH